MRRLLPLLLIVWAAGAVVWALVQDDDSEKRTSENEPPAKKAAPAEPAVAAKPPPGVLMTRAADPLPSDIHATLHAKTTRESFAKLWAWVEGGKGRLTQILLGGADGSSLVAGQEGLGAYLLVQRFLAPSRAKTLRYKDEVLAAFDKARASKDPRALHGVLAAMGVLAHHVRERMEALLELSRDAARTPYTRALAAEVLLLIDAQDFSAHDAVAEVLRAGGKGDEASSWILDRVRARGEKMRALVPVLLEAHDRRDGSWPHERSALKALAAADPNSHAVRLRLARELHPGDKWVAKIARDTLFSGSVSEILAVVRELSGIARVIGIEELVKRKVDKAVLSPLLVPVLVHEDVAARTRAITAMAHIGTDTGPYMAAIEELLGSKKDESRWVSGVQALGELSSIPGDKAVAIQRLFGLTRSPNVKVRITAVQSVLMHRTSVDAKLEMLAELLKDSVSKVRAEAVDGLGELVSEDRRAVTHLKLALSDKDKDVREMAKYWLEDTDDGTDDDADDR